MRFVKFLVALFATMGAVYALNTNVLPQAPAFGKLLNPFSGFWQNADPYKPLPEGKAMDLPDLKGKVTVAFDERMVPHIFAENDLDAVYVQGYIHAKDRLWQMDVGARATGGSLAEVLGESLLERDKIQRRKGIVFAAENAIKAWQKSPEDWALVQAYTNGVNAYINNLPEANYPVEYKILGYAPEAWTPLKSALFLKAMAETLAANQTDIEATNTRKLLGDKAFDLLFPENDPNQSPIIPKNVKWNFKKVDAATAPVAFPEGTTSYKTHPLITNTTDNIGIGSNNWAVSGKKTVSGKPILCSDPHLKLTLPAIWYEMQLHTPNMNCYGVSLPGTFGIIIGFNENIAWGITNAGHDVMDWYKITWADKSKNAYMLDGSAKNVVKRIETINVKGRKEPVLDTVRYTVWGPVTYENDTFPQHDMAMRWQSHDTPSSKEAGSLLRLDAAKNYDEYIKALADYGSPAQNFVFAAKTGDIAIKVQGKLPIKTPHQGRFVQDGSQSSAAWHGFIPNDQLPLVKNPPRNFVSSANQHSTAADYPYYYNGGFDHYRGRILNTKLDTMQHITIEKMMALQTNTQSLFGKEGVAALLKNLDTTQLDNSEKEIAHKLRKWDGYFDKKLVEPIFFANWFDLVEKAAWDDDFKKKDMQLLTPDWWRTVDLLDKQPKLEYFDDKSTPAKETAKELVTTAFKKMYADIKPKLILPGYDWESHITPYIPHLFARLKAFQVKGISAGGHRSALNALAMRKDGNGFNGPSWRMVVELGDTVKAYGVYPGGPSGNPGNAAYNTSIEKWAKGEYFELSLWKKIEDMGKQGKLSSVQSFF
jgi:penicillin G amidase